MILVDTSVWIDHLRYGDQKLSILLDRNFVLVHPMVIGELACGNLKDRKALLNLWANLPAIQTVTDYEALFFLEHNKLMGTGIGFIDLHLLAATSLFSKSYLWTKDKRLKRIANKLDIAFSIDR